MIIKLGLESKYLDNHITWYTWGDKGYDFNTWINFSSFYDWDIWYKIPINEWCSYERKYIYTHNYVLKCSNNVSSVSYWNVLHCDSRIYPLYEDAIDNIEYS